MTPPDLRDDPHQADLAAADAAARPMVGRTSSPFGATLGVLGVVVLGVGAFLVMNGQRLAHADAHNTPGASRPALALPALQELADAALNPPASSQPASPTPAPLDPAPMALSVTTTMPDPAIAAGGSPADPSQHLRAPALVVDLAQNDTVVSDPYTNSEYIHGAPSASEPQPSLGADEKFAARIGGQQTDTAPASRLADIKTLIPQGTVIPAVLETAIDSDTPGYTRAIVSRDVRGYDQSSVLIPRGSRLIGQYRAGVAQGQSRVFVVWQRVLTPAGISVQLGSPGSDSLGRGGVGGDVNNHFFTQFGGAILLSVLNGGLNALSNLQGGSQVYIGSPVEAGNVAAQALQKSSVQPTIKTPQGAAINIFVARDLDFSGVRALR